jgi:hypothetical protein
MTKLEEHIEEVINQCLTIQPKTFNEPQAHLREMMRLAIRAYRLTVPREPVEDEGNPLV